MSYIDSNVFKVTCYIALVANIIVNTFVRLNSIHL